MTKPESRKYRVQAAHPADGRVVSFVDLTVGEAMAKADELVAGGYFTVNVSTPEQAGDLTPLGMMLT